MASLSLQGPIGTMHLDPLTEIARRLGVQGRRTKKTSMSYMLSGLGFRV